MLGGASCAEAARVPAGPTRLPAASAIAVPARSCRREMRDLPPADAVIFVSSPISPSAAIAARRVPKRLHRPLAGIYSRANISIRFAQKWVACARSVPSGVGRFRRFLARPIVPRSIERPPGRGHPLGWRIAFEDTPAAVARRLVARHVLPELPCPRAGRLSERLRRRAD